MSQDPRTVPFSTRTNLMALILVSKRRPSKHRAGVTGFAGIWLSRNATLCIYTLEMPAAAFGAPAPVMMDSRPWLTWAGEGWQGAGSHT